MLTGKAKIFYDKWLIEYYLKNRPDYDKFSRETILNKHYRKTDVEQNALIINFFDCLGIYITTKPSNFSFNTNWKFSILNHHNSPYDYNSRNSAIKSAISKSLEIYNSKQ